MSRTAERAASLMDRAEPIEQARAVALVKAAQIVGMVLFTVAAPRLMGPEGYGRFAVILSIVALWRTASNLGGRFIFGRFVPEYVARGEASRVPEVFLHVLGTRLGIALLAVPLLVLFLRQALPEASALTLAAAAGAFAAMAASGPVYHVLFGLNRLAVSMSGDPIARYTLLALLLVFGGAASLERATLSLLAAQAVALAVGCGLSRRLFALPPGVFDPRSLAVHVRFGLAIFAASLLLRLPWRLGEGALALARVDPAEIAFYNIAVAATVGFTRLAGGATTLLIPSLGVRQAAGDLVGRDRSLGTALRYLTVAACLFYLLVRALSPWAVRLLLGEEFLGVVPRLAVVALAAIPAPLIRTALSLAVVSDRIRRSAQLGATAAATFLVAALLLVPGLGAPGAAAALASAVAAAALGAALQIRGSGVLRQARARRLALAAAPPLILLAVGGSSAAVAFLAAAGYLVLVVALRLVAWRELRRLFAGRARRPDSSALRGGGDR